MRGEHDADLARQVLEVGTPLPGGEAERPNIARTAASGLVAGVGALVSGAAGVATLVLAVVVPVFVVAHVLLRH